MSRPTLDTINSCLADEGDWTVRLKTERFSSPEKYIFGYIHFDGHKDTWASVFFNQNKKNEFEFIDSSFSKVKETFIKQITEFLSKGYDIAGIFSGYVVPPWLLRKR